MFRRVLIANRGEIAVRIAQTLQEMNIEAVAVYSDADANAKHVMVANRAYPLGGLTPAESYLDTEKILNIACKAGVDAIHPGFGFLSEKADFAKACKDAGIVFIGPSPDAIEVMGDKIASKLEMQEANVPVVPSWTGDPDDTQALEKAAEELGYPILVKAAAGGGGKGMRVVQDASELEAAVDGAKREAEKAFGDNRVFIERYITKPRHIEFQIFGDTHGNVVHLFERECSIQRRHQKIFEETPSPALTPELREAMGKAAVEAAKAIDYVNAGTVEFILDDEGRFYFLEMNTRLQVEHPVTEMTTGQNLVRAQLLVASGEPLPFKQEDLTQTGHAIECRIYAEDPDNQFFPSTGKIAVYHEPVGPGIRVDSGIRQGDEVTIHYDPMLSKLIVWDKTRNAALEKIRWALKNYVILGVTTNIGFLRDLVWHPALRAGNIDTHFLERHSIISKVDEERREEAMAITAMALKSRRPVDTGAQASESGNTTSAPWFQAGSWRNV